MSNIPIHFLAQSISLSAIRKKKKKQDSANFSFAGNQSIVN